MRIGIRVAVMGLVLASIAVSAIGVHLLWWRTAQGVSETLAATINEQIVSAVSDELQSITTEAKSAAIAVRTLYLNDVFALNEAEKRNAVFLSQLQAQPTISWVAFGRGDGGFAAVHKRGNASVEIIWIPPDSTEASIDRFALSGIDNVPESNRTETTSYALKDQDWFREMLPGGAPRWFSVSALPQGDRTAVAYAGPMDAKQPQAGVLAIIIELTRVSQFLSQLTIGKSAGAFILDQSGAVIASPDADADEVNPLKTDHPLFPVAVSALQAATGYDPDNAEARRVQVTRDGKGYQAVLTPISFPGWSLVTVIPESEFLGPVQETIRQLLIGLAVLIVIAGALSAWLARSLIAAPLLKVVGEVRHVAKFDLDKVERHHSRLTEINELSRAIADMALGLSAFRKYIPADLVKLLVSEGNEAKLGGAVRPMTVMFVDMAGFTGLSERIGDRIIPLLSRYFDVLSAQVQSHGGTIDKFIGDAVMAFWGAPRLSASHARDCCRAALACTRAIAEAGLADDADKPIRIRIGINSGDMLVGNIGSEVRLNYTVIGDAVNIASRLESANKIYGSEIIIGDATRRLAGDGIVVRELDRLAVHGRAGGQVIYELLAMAGESATPDWVASYEAGLAAWRAKDFTRAIGCFESAIAARGGDAASARMIALCRAMVDAPPGDDWSDMTVALEK